MDDPLYLFNQYDTEYCSLFAEVSSKLKTAENLSGQERTQKFQEVETNLKQTESALKKLQQELRALPPTLNTQVSDKVKKYQQDVKKLKTDLQTIKQNSSQGDGARAMLGLDGQSSQREQMLGATQQLHQTNEKIKQGQAMLNEAEAEGVAILQQLHGQREQLQNTHAKLREADAGMQQSNKILRKMEQRTKWWHIW
eukprot:TRINITY_DN12687_c0_g1_i3.p1 TRINITY_DN12687_c0_g1~~TRINITY_DN12687_c0_g1_i3.p1  ORF type:complete len:204 (+),score=27.79 TRINITY_DN12687_c0_g1_i3:23-613(+)